jgi:hypothetical protein
MTRASPTQTPRMPRHDPQPAAGAAPAPALHIGIDRVTLHGFTAADRLRFTRSLEASLAELATAHRDHDWRSLGPAARIARLDAGQLRPGESAEAAARHVAQALFAEVTGRGTGARHA